MQQFFRGGTLHQAIEPATNPGAEWHGDGCWDGQKEHQVIVMPDEEGADGEDDAGQYVDAVFGKAAPP